MSCLFGSCTKKTKVIDIKAAGNGSVSGAQTNRGSVYRVHGETSPPTPPLHLRIESTAINPEHAPRIKTRQIQQVSAEKGKEKDLMAWVQKPKTASPIEKPSHRHVHYSPTIPSASLPQEKENVGEDAIELREDCQSPRKPEEGTPQSKPKRSPLRRHTAELAIPAMEPIPGSAVIIPPLRRKESCADKDDAGLIIAPLSRSALNGETRTPKSRPKVAPPTPKILAASPLSVFNIEVEVPSLQASVSSQPKEPKASKKLKPENSRSLSDHIKQQEREHKQREEDSIKATGDGVPFQEVRLPAGGSSTLLSVLLETPKSSAS